jgi:hypothetical protein
MGTGDSRDTPSLSAAVIHEVAECEDVPPAELNPPLYDVVDPDALDMVFRRDTGQISFEFHEYVVTVDHSGDVDLVPSEVE